MGKGDFELYYENLPNCRFGQTDSQGFTDEESKRNTTAQDDLGLMKHTSSSRLFQAQEILDEFKKNLEDAKNVNLELKRKVGSRLGLDMQSDEDQSKNAGLKSGQSQLRKINQTSQHNFKKSENKPQGKLSDWDQPKEEPNFKKNGHFFEGEDHAKIGRKKSPALVLKNYSNAHLAHT